MTIRALILLTAIAAVPAFGQSLFLKTYRLGDSTAVTTARTPGNSISQVEVDGGNVYIGTGNGLARSTDGGRTWSSYRSNTAFASEGTYAVTARHDTVWVSTGYDTQTGDGSTQTGSGYAWTHDAGLHWAHAGQPLDTCIELSSSNGHRICQSKLTMPYGINDSVIVLAVTTPVANVSYDLALTTGTVWAASWSSGLRKSTDNGATWERILLPLDGQNRLRPTDTLWTFADADTLHLHRIYLEYNVVQHDNLKAFSVAAEDDNTIWCGTAGGVNRSTDAGVSWEKFNHQNQASPILGNWVIGLGVQHLSGYNRIWTTNWKTTDPTEEYGVSYTQDDGQTWVPLLRGIKAYDFAFKDSIAYIATDNGIYRTSDGGASFTRFNSFTDNVSHQAILGTQAFAAGVLGDTIFVGTGDGLVRTIDNTSHTFGTSWIIDRTYESVAGTTSTYSYPNPFSPKFEYTRIHFATGSAAGSSVPVRIEIFDFGMNRVRTLLNSTRTAGNEYDEIWDGSRDDGRIAANGTYFYRVVVGDSDAIFGKIIVLQ
jgi:hypothetical protein